jgi:hypothetical protein
MNKLRQYSDQTSAEVESHVEGVQLQASQLDEKARALPTFFLHTCVSQLSFDAALCYILLLWNKVLALQRTMLSSSERIDTSEQKTVPMFGFAVFYLRLCSTIVLCFVFGICRRNTAVACEDLKTV